MRYVGTELNSELLALAKSKGIIGIEAGYDLSKLIEPESLDLVVAFDVLEHLTLQEIADLFSSVKNCLKDGGRLIARFPSGDSPFSRAIQYGDMTHKSIIGSLMIRQLSTEAGFQVLQVREPSFPIRGLGPVRFFRRLPIVFMRYVATRFINLFFNDNMPMVISPNMLVVLKK
jgi:predicted TPR repeat methyltransferase